MPRIQYGSYNTEAKGKPDWNNLNFDYDYPRELKLKPGTKLHDDLVEKVMERATESYDIVSSRHDSWNEIDRVLTAYAIVDDDEKEVTDEDSRKPTTIIFPYSYAILETLISYLMTAFIQSPIFRYEGSAPEDTLGAILMEKAIEHNVLHNKVALSLHTMFRDSLSYGFGVGTPWWYVENGQKVEKVPQYSMFHKFLGIDKVTGYDKVLKDVTLYEGNALSTIDPYLCLPDPNVPIQNVQSGEYFGWIDSTNIFDLLSDEKNDPDIFNVRYLKEIKNRQTSLVKDGGGSAREEKTFDKGRLKENTLTTKTDVIKMFVKLIPEEWELGRGQYPEKWEFAVGADEVLIKAKPLGLNHNRFPIAIAAPDYDGYSSTPVSRLEILYGMQHIVDFLFNSHITNVRKAINDMFIVDPYIVNVDDLKNPKPGKIIRTRRPVWGKGVKDAVQQFAVNDITRNNISDVTFIVEYMHKISSVDDAAMGNLRRGGPERLTGAEFEGTRAGMVSRMERIAKVIGLQAMQDIGYFFASHTQQLMSQDTYVSITGEWYERLLQEYGTLKDDRLKVSPESILVNYDLIVRDGSVPGSNFSKVWLEMFNTIAKVPELQQSFDIVKIFNHIARNSGAKNVSEFRKVNAGVMPDQQVQQAVQAGNIRPIQGSMAQPGMMPQGGM